MHPDPKVFLNNGHEDSADSAVIRKQTYRQPFSQSCGTSEMVHLDCQLDQTWPYPGGKSMGEFLYYFSWGGRTQHNWETPYTGLASWIVYKGESKLNASIHLSAVYCGYDVTNYTTLLLQDLLFRDGLHPQTMSQNNPLIDEAALLRHFATVSGKETIYTLQTSDWVWTRKAYMTI